MLLQRPAHRRLLILPIDFGSVPVSELLYRLNSSNLSRFPNEDGKVPERLLLDRRSERRGFKSPIDVGIVPLKLFCFRSLFVLCVSVRESLVVLELTKS